MRVVEFAKIFLIIWLALVGSACPGMLLAGILMLTGSIRLTFSPGALIPFVMFIFGCALGSICFIPERNKAKSFLLQILNATEKEQPGNIFS